MHGNCLVDEQFEFLSFHTIQTQTNYMSCKKDRRALRPPAKWVNWTKWSKIVCAPTAEKSIQDRTSGQSEPKVLHDRNKCWADSIPPHPAMQKWCSGEIMPRVTKFVFVGNWLRKRRHTKIDTFKGSCLCHIRSSAAPKVNWVLWSQELIRIMNRVPYNGIWLSLPHIWRLSLHKNIKK
jgi:hypothetical protein